MRKTKKALASLAIAGMVLSMAPMSVFGATTTNRISDADRVGTAIAIAANGWTASDNVIVVPADDANMVDALAAAPLAGQLNAPILVTYKGALDPKVQQKIIDLKAKNVYAVGALSADAVASLKAISGVTVTTLQGADRTETAALVAAKLTNVKGSFVVAYDGKADALSAASFAAANGYSILIANPDGSIPTSETAYKVAPTYTVGGQVKVDGATALAGADRYATNDAVINGLSYTYNKVYVANGETLVDALAGAPLAAQTKSPIVLADASHAATGANDNLTASSQVIALGGTGAVADSVLSQVAYQAPATLAVQSVSAINAKQFQIVFNKAVDDTTFGSIAFTAQGSATAPGALTFDLSDDEQTLTVTTASTLTQNGYYFASITGVKDTDGNTINPYTTVIKLSDTTAPSIASTDGTTNVSSTRTFKLKFNEPALLDLVKVGDVVASATPDSYFKTYTVTLPGSADALSAGNSYAVTVNGLRDFAGNYASTSSVATNVAIVQDTVKPTFTVNPVNPVQLKVVFSKDMSSTLPVDGITVKKADGTVLPLASMPTLGSDNRTVTANLFASPIAADKDSADLTVTVKNFADKIGNVIDSKDVTVTVVNSTVKPAISSVHVDPSDATKIDVTFNEPATGIQVTDFVLTRNGDTASTPITLSTVSGIDSNNQVVLTLASALTKSDTYTLALKVGSVGDASGNTNDAQVSTFTFSAPAAAQITAAITATTNGTTAVNSTNKKVYIKFNAADINNGVSNTTGNYKDGAADNPANYTLDGTALPKGTVVTFVDNDAANAGNDAVVLDFTAVTGTNLPDEFANGGNAVVTVSGVKNGAGSTLQYTSNQIAVADTTAPTIGSAYLTGSAAAGYTVTLAMSEKMATAVAPGEFTFNVGGTPVSVATAAVSATDATKVILTFATGADTTTISGGIAAGTFTVDVAPTGTNEQDLAGNALGSVSGFAVTSYAGI